MSKVIAAPDRREYYRQYRLDNLDKVKKKDKRHGKAKAKLKKYGSVWSRTRYPEKYKARYLLNNAIASGKVIKQPCIDCGNKKSHGHHEDYSKPLEVVWLCNVCHVKHHRSTDE